MAENSPSAVLKELVEKLKRDLADKEKRAKAMAKAIADLKRELMEQAEAAATATAAAAPATEAAEAKGGRPEAETAASLRRRVEDLNARYPTCCVRAGPVADCPTNVARGNLVVGCSEAFFLHSPNTCPWRTNAI